MRHCAVDVNRCVYVCVCVIMNTKPNQKPIPWQCGNKKVESSWAGWNGGRGAFEERNSLDFF